MGVAKAAFESTARYLARELGPEGDPRQPGRGRPDPDDGGQVDPGLRGVRGRVARQGAAGLGHHEPGADGARLRRRCCRTGSRRRRARSSTSTAASTRWAELRRDVPDRRRRLVLVRHAKSARPARRPRPGPAADRPRAPGRRRRPADGSRRRARGPTSRCARRPPGPATPGRSSAALPVVPTRSASARALRRRTPTTSSTSPPRRPTDVRTLVVVGHEPTTSVDRAALAGRGSDRRALEALADEFPTSAMAVLRFDGPWTDLAAGRAGPRVVHRAAGLRPLARRIEAPAVRAGLGVGLLDLRRG